MKPASLVLVIVALLAPLSGCSEEKAPSAEAPPAAPAEAPAEPAPAAPEVSADEACLRGVLVSYAGATAAAEGVTRTKEEASARATELRAKVVAGEPLKEVAKAEGDGSRAARGGQLGTFTRASWPEFFVDLKEPGLALPMGGVSEIIEAPYGFIFVERCAVEKVHTQHILIRYAGARNAGDEVTRTKEQARALAEETRVAAAAAPGAEFAVLAREKSEDGSAEQGGDVGVQGRGMLEPEYEQAAFALAPGAVSQVVETGVGFHVIRRVE